MLSCLQLLINQLLLELVGVYIIHDNELFFKYKFYMFQNFAMVLIGTEGWKDNCDNVRDVREKLKPFGIVSNTVEAFHLSPFSCYNSPSIYMVW